MSHIIVQRFIQTLDDRVDVILTCAKSLLSSSGNSKANPSASTSTNPPLGTASHHEDVEVLALEADSIIKELREIRKSGAAMSTKQRDVLQECACVAWNTVDRLHFTAESTPNPSCALRQHPHPQQASLSEKRTFVSLFAAPRHHSSTDVPRTRALIIIRLMSAELLMTALQFFSPMVSELEAFVLTDANLSLQAALMALRSSLDLTAYCAAFQVSWSDSTKDPAAPPLALPCDGSSPLPPKNRESNHHPLRGSGAVIALTFQSSQEWLQLAKTILYTLGRRHGALQQGRILPCRRTGLIPRAIFGGDDTSGFSLLHERFNAVLSESVLTELTLLRYSQQWDALATPSFCRYAVELLTDATEWHSDPTKSLPASRTVEGSFITAPSEPRTETFAAFSELCFELATEVLFPPSPSENGDDPTATSANRSSRSFSSASDSSSIGSSIAELLYELLKGLQRMAQLEDREGRKLGWARLVESAAVLYCTALSRAKQHNDALLAIQVLFPAVTNGMASFPRVREEPCAGRGSSLQLADLLPVASSVGISTDRAAASDVSGDSATMLLPLLRLVMDSFLALEDDVGALDCFHRQLQSTTNSLRAGRRLRSLSPNEAADLATRIVTRRPHLSLECAAALLSVFTYHAVHSNRKETQGVNDLMDVSLDSSLEPLFLVILRLLFYQRLVRTPSSLRKVVQEEWWERIAARFFSSSSHAACADDHSKEDESTEGGRTVPRSDVPKLDTVLDIAMLLLGTISLLGPSPCEKNLASAARPFGAKYFHTFFLWCWEAGYERLPVSLVRGSSDANHETLSRAEDDMVPDPVRAVQALRLALEFRVGADADEGSSLLRLLVAFYRWQASSTASEAGAAHLTDATGGAAPPSSSVVSTREVSLAEAAQFAADAVNVTPRSVFSVLAQMDVALDRNDAPTMQSALLRLPDCEPQEDLYDALEHVATRAVQRLSSNMEVTSPSHDEQRSFCVRVLQQLFQYRATTARTAGISTEHDSFVSWLQIVDQKNGKALLQLCPQQRASETSPFSSCTAGESTIQKAALLLRSYVICAIAPAVAGADPEADVSSCTTAFSPTSALSLATLRQLHQFICSVLAEFVVQSHGDALHSALGGDDGILWWTSTCIYLGHCLHDAWQEKQHKECTTAPSDTAEAKLTQSFRWCHAAAKDLYLIAWQLSKKEVQKSDSTVTTDSALLDVQKNGTKLRLAVILALGQLQLDTRVAECRGDHPPHATTMQSRKRPREPEDPQEPEEAVDAKEVCAHPDLSADCTNAALCLPRSFMTRLASEGKQIVYDAAAVDGGGQANACDEYDTALVTLFLVEFDQLIQSAVTSSTSFHDGLSTMEEVREDDLTTTTTATAASLYHSPENPQRQNLQLLVLEVELLLESLSAKSQLRPSDVELMLSMVLAVRFEIASRGTRNGAVDAAAGNQALDWFLSETQRKVNELLVLRYALEAAVDSSAKHICTVSQEGLTALVRLMDCSRSREQELLALTLFCGAHGTVSVPSAFSCASRGRTPTNISHHTDEVSSCSVSSSPPRWLNIAQALLSAFVENCPLADEQGRDDSSTTTQRRETDALRVQLEHCGLKLLSLAAPTADALRHDVPHHHHRLLHPSVASFANAIGPKHQQPLPPLPPPAVGNSPIDAENAAITSSLTSSLLTGGGDLDAQWDAVRNDPRGLALLESVTVRCWNHTCFYANLLLASSSRASNAQKSAAIFLRYAKLWCYFTEYFVSVLPADCSLAYVAVEAQFPAMERVLEGHLSPGLT